ncbi:MAG: START-like domain-containing protein [Bacteroidota bacterium]
MSTKTKASSKNKKATSKKVTPKKVVAKKPVAKKKATKPAKKTVAKKAVVKAKKVVKPVKKAVAKKKAPAKPIKKAVKKVAVKKAVAKKVVKKAAKPVKKAAVKKAVKQVIAKKAAKPVKKVVAKKVAKPVKKVIAKKAAPKKDVKSPVKATPKKGFINTHESKPLHSKVSTVKEIKHIIEEVTEHVSEKPAKALKVKKEKAPIIRKPIVAPTTFRKPDNEVPQKFMKEPAGKFEMEFVIRASEDMVFEFVSTESGLSEWFCDDVNIRDGVFTFNWDGQIQQAKLVKEIPPISIRYQWLDKNDGSYFEFKTQKDELTNDISLIITDFASDKADEVSARLLWHSQVDKLLHVLGSFF